MNRNQLLNTGFTFLFRQLVIILMLVFLREYFWIALPFVATSLAKALRIM